MIKILTIVGARPQFVKAAVVSRAISHVDGVEEVVVHTGQHFDKNMSEVFFEEMGIPLPNYNLNIHSLSHGAMTGKMLEGVEQIMMQEAPDMVLVYGDTNSTLAGALAAAKLHIPIAHVEAGLRSFNMRMPEEINRILTDRISTYLFCPTSQAVMNLKQEGFGQMPVKISQPGDVMLDASLYYGRKRPPQDAVKPYVLTTLHREENVRNPERIRSIIDALNEIHTDFGRVIMPLHPGTAKRLKEYGITPAFDLIEPVGYLDMIDLIRGASIVITDSGGVQKEAFFFNKYCLTLRDETEWVELVEAGVNFLTGASKEELIARVAYVSKLDFPGGLAMYGYGDAGERIIKEIVK